MAKSKNGRAKHKPGQSWRLLRIVRLPLFAKVYVLSSVLVLLVTTIFWSLLSAHVQRGNADQLIDSLLFEHVHTFHTASFPGAHTFLIKWPLFVAIQLFGPTARAFDITTVGTVVVTITVLAMILYRIVRRPLVFGSLCLALASVLLLVPAQPYPGALLPVNMAMVTTRNLEYVLYIGSLVLIVKAKALRNWRFWLAVSLMAVLIASDKLFLTVSLGGALLALSSYVLSRRWNLALLSVNWLLVSVLATIGAIGITWLINVSGQTHIMNQSTISPYGFVQNLHALALGSIYAALGILTNFGANPVNNYGVLRTIPHQAYQGLVSLSGLAFIINALLLAAGGFAVFRLLKASYGKSSRMDTAVSLSILLIWTAIAAIGIFAVTVHDYAVDARYLTIVLFAVFVAIATCMRTQRWQPASVVLIGFVGVLGIGLGLFRSNTMHANESATLNVIDKRNVSIVQVLRNHPVNVLVGDYWRVIPIKFISHSSLPVMPLSDCTQFRTGLSSMAWQLDLHKHSFAYLLTLDGNPADYPACSLKQVIATYGRPNETTLMAGSLNRPQELLLFYDHGIRTSAPKNEHGTQQPATVLPIALSDLPYTVCPVQTVMNIVAHEDDDLLFMNPDLSSSLTANECVRTIYLTAGDGGNASYYWLSREQGAKAAYSHMLGSNAVWIQRIVELNSHEYISVANPRGNMRLSLIFMHLPDGGIKGQGFANSKYESLLKLETGRVGVLHSIDGQSYYTSAQLVAALTAIMHTYMPTAIRTQVDYPGTRFPDHSDHLATGNFARLAYEQYEQQQFGGTVAIPITYYVGYPIRALPANLSGQDTQQKMTTFLAYAKFDGATCQTEQQCRQAPAYGAYLSRQYARTY